MSRTRTLSSSPCMWACVAVLLSLCLVTHAQNPADGVSCPAPPLTVEDRRLNKTQLRVGTPGRCCISLCIIHATIRTSIICVLSDQQRSTELGCSTIPNLKRRGLRIAISRSISSRSLSRSFDWMPTLFACRYLAGSLHLPSVYTVVLCMPSCVQTSTWP